MALHWCRIVFLHASAPTPTPPAVHAVCLTQVKPNQFETRFRDNVITPLLPYVPASVHPNTITVTSMLVVCGLSVLGVAAQVGACVLVPCLPRPSLSPPPSPTPTHPPTHASTYPPALTIRCLGSFSIQVAVVARQGESGGAGSRIGAPPMSVCVPFPACHPRSSYVAPISVAAGR